MACLSAKTLGAFLNWPEGSRVDSSGLNLGREKRHFHSTKMNESQLKYTTRTASWQSCTGLRPPILVIPCSNPFCAGSWPGPCQPLQVDARRMRQRKLDPLGTAPDHPEGEQSHDARSSTIGNWRHFCMCASMNEYATCSKSQT